MQNNIELQTLEKFAENSVTMNLLRKYLLQLAVKGTLIEVKNWKEKRLEEISSIPIIDGDWIESKDQDPTGKIRLIQLADVGEGFFKDKSQKFVNEDTFRRLNCTLLEKNDVLIARLPDPIGRACLFPDLNQKCITVVDVAIFKANSDIILPEFLVLLINSPSVNREIVEQSAGTTRQRVATGKLKKLIVRFPLEIEVQQEIVDKYRDLIAILDQMHTLINERDRNASLVCKSSLDSIATAKTQEEFETAWNRIQQNWDVIAGTSESINEMRGLILTLATSGLLVKQDLSEAQPRFVSVTDSKQIPENWIWSELEAISQYGGSGSVIPESIPKESWILDLEDIEKKTSKLLNRSFAADRKTSSNKTPFEVGDVLYGKLRPYLDKVLVADMPGFCTTEIVPIKPKEGLDPNWLRICLKRPEFVKKVTELSYGTKMPRLGTSDAKKSVHPIPPLEEQRRIVERVDQLMQICDQLEKELILANDLAERFSRSVVSASGW